jgi:hypothetical protein
MSSNLQVIPDMMPEEAMYGFLGDAVRATDAPKGPAYCAALALVAGRGINLSANTVGPRPNIYVVAVGAPNAGKTGSFNRVRDVMRLRERRDYIKTSPVSDTGVLRMFRGNLKNTDPAPTTPDAKLIFSDEMRRMLKKMDIENSGLAELFNELWDGDYTSVYKAAVALEINTRVSIYTCLTASDPDEFREWFGSDLTGGFASRSVIAPVPSGWDWDLSWIAPSLSFPGEEPPAEFPIDGPGPYGTLGVAKDAEWEERKDRGFRPSLAVSFPKELYAIVSEWEAGYKARGIDPDRVPAIALSVAVISAAGNGESTVTPECLKAALAFGDWQMSVREVYQPSEARNEEAKLTNIIRRLLKRAQDAHYAGEPLASGRNRKGETRYITDEQGWAKWAILQNDAKLSVTYGATKIMNQLTAMVRSGEVLQKTIQPPVNDKTGRSYGRPELLSEFKLNPAFIDHTHAVPVNPAPTEPVDLEAA